MQFFLSHAAEDSEIASVLKRLIEQCSLRQATVWFSSDTSPTGGVAPGTPWFDQLVSKIDESVAFLVLVTPASVSNLWLHYEAGCAATKNLPIVPLVAGLSVNDVRKPLNIYNAYNISQPESLKSALIRLFQERGLPSDPDMFETPVQSAIRKITPLLRKLPGEGSFKTESDTGKILRHIDQRFMDLFGQLSEHNNVPPPSYNVFANVIRNGEIVEQVSVDISANDSLGDVSHALYFKIEQYVEPFTYLVEWIVKDKTLGVHLVMRDFLDHVPAHVVIKPGHEYEIILLSKPFDPTKDSASAFD